MTAMQLRLLSGTSQQALINLGVLQAQAAAPGGHGGDSEGNGTAPGTVVGSPLSPGGGSTIPSSVFPGRDGRCSQSAGGNVRLNTACTNYADAPLSGRSMAQNETAIAINPVNPSNLVASANDYSRGDGNCGSYYSSDGGRIWNGTTAPMLFVRGSSLTPPSGIAREYWQAGGDTAVAYNSKGTAYLQCQVFNRGRGTQDPDTSSAVLIFRSANGGASWDFPGRVALSTFDKTGNILEDKPFLTIDNRVGSPFQDRIYITWTSFLADGTAYIDEVSSSDGGETWTPRKAISGNSATLCPVTFGIATPHGSCNQNQFSDPFIGPDGTLYVVYDNYNNAVSGNDNRNQVLLVKSTDGGATFSAPIKVTDYYDLPDCATYTGMDAGRACVVNKGATKTSVFRATNYPSGVVDPTNPAHIVVNIGSYLNRKSNEHTECVPAGFAASGNNAFTGAGTAACNNQILQSESTNGGSSFNGTTKDPRVMPLATTQKELADEFWQWTGIASDGGIVVGFYDRQYGNDDTSGASDYSVSVNGHSSRVSEVSSPPPTEFGGLFYGDYNALSVVGSNAWVTWTDDRNPGLTSCPGNTDAICTLGQDEDAFAARVRLTGEGGDNNN